MSIIVPLPYVIQFYSFNEVDIKDNILEMFLQLSIPTIIAAIIKIMIEFQKDENKIKKLNIVRKILNIISAIYLLLYELFLIFVIIVVKSMGNAGPWQN